MDESLVQGRSEVAKPVDALAITQRLRQGAPQRQGCKVARGALVSMQHMIRRTADLATVVFMQQTSSTI